ncbi:PilC domain-containing protein [Rhodanobacter fulvus Jip2]|uniref:PilC domain-containing protein n=2 Tax=Rhodanobacter TaxID=75309 RepID=I4VMD6_9GAMM|nr:PilC domain-containing protein [Rhodanobacter fulvus Jip2]
MLVMSRDEQLFIKAYSDYTDLDNDGVVDTTYNDAFDYSGYFDSSLCYTYANTQFKASAAASGGNADGQKKHQCSGNWSGNFLNWVSMSRLDVVRLVLDGGLRSTDNPNRTVLKRAPIPNDLHAWAKVYTGTDVNKFTPFIQDTSNLGISFCNATLSADGDPQMRVARGNWSEWASTASRQCDWKETIGTPDANNSYNDDASKNDGLGDKEYIVQVEVCDPSTNGIRESFCQLYSNGSSRSYKPVGLLQRYGENGQMRFGLLTGSFSAPRSGGVLRRNIGKLAGNGNDPATCVAGDEIKLSDGTFCNQDDGKEGIINTLHRLKLTNWNFNNNWNDCNTYGILNRNETTNGTNNRLDDPGSSGTNAQACSAWGNPLSEMYAEALRYIAADGAKTAKFIKAGDLAGLPSPAWKDPYAASENPYCASCSVIVLSTGLNSFDSDELPPWTKAGIGMNAASATQAIGADEGINGNNYLTGRVVATQTDLAVGKPVNTYEDLCSSKLVSDLSLARGICPDIPSMEGSFLIAGLAFDAWTKDLRPDLGSVQGSTRPAGYKNTVQTYAVALAENLPKFQLPIGSKSITLAPLCQANNTGGASITDSGWRSCYLGAVGVGTKTSRVDTSYIYGRPLLADARAGSYSLVWEDSLWGNDHDNDVVSMLTYCVGDTCARSTNLPQKLPAATVCFYKNTNYGGGSWCPSTDTTPHNFPVGDGFRDVISSVKVPAGYKLTLYTGENLSGTSASFTADTANVGSALNDKARSYSVGRTGSSFAGYDICWQSDSAICTDNAGKPTVGNDEALVRIENLSAYAGNAMLTGYTISGSSDDGVKRLALRPGNANASVLTSQANAPASWYKPKVVKYTVGSTGAKQLENPLYYAAKYGGFAKITDTSGVAVTAPCDKTTTPACATSNWDQNNNDTGLPGADNVPDNFFPVRNPAQLGERLASVFNAILTRSGSGTSAAVVTSSAAGEGLTYQALYQGKTQNVTGSQSVSWTGAVNALWIDSDGQFREGGYDIGGSPTLGDASQNPIVRFCTTADGDSRFHTYTDPTVAPTKPIPAAQCNGKPLSDLKPVWSAQNMLSSASYQTLTQRAYGTAATGAAGRYIFTWIDADHDGVVDTGEQKDFAWSSSGFGGNGTCDSSTVTGNFRFLNTCSSNGAESLVDWIRGTEWTGSDGRPDPNWRSRTVDGKVYRLGDIVNSTPLAVGVPAESFDLLYNDSSYGGFRKKYQSRRQMIYVGANDGMIHAFNGGFYNASEKRLDTQPSTCTSQGCSLDSAFTAHPLGSEVWAYVPGNLLAHLRWLSDPDYAHMFYVDGSPISQDVRIFTASDENCSVSGSTQCHPDGWGTILIVPFRFGGGPITVDTKEGAASTYQASFPAYVVLDVTNPEAPPVLLAELTNAQGLAGSGASAGCASTLFSCANLMKTVSTYTSSLPAVAMFRPSGSADPDPSKFILFTGSGTTDNGGSGSVEGGNAISTAGLGIRAYDLSDIASSDPTPLSWGTGNGTVKMMTNVGAANAGANSFAGDVVASDFNLDGVAESLYFGSSKGAASPFGGALWAIDFKGSVDPADWSPRMVLSGLDKPVTIRPTLGVNDKRQHMVFFGTGRAYTKSDLQDKNQQVIVGLVDDGTTSTVSAGTPAVTTNSTVSFADLLDVTDVDVMDDGTVSGAGDDVTTIADLAAASQTAHGWKSNLDIPTDANGAKMPSERVVSTQVLAGGVLNTSTYLPGTDQCTDQGEGRLVPSNYLTGTADVGLIGILGKDSDGKINKSVELGKGLPSQPSLSKGGSGSSGDKDLRACVQTSSGAIICHDLPPLKSVRSGEISWREPLDK